MYDYEKIIRNFIAAWSRLDTQELSSYFCDHGIYHNMPMAPVSGRDDIAKFIARFIVRWTATEWEILNIMTDGDVVVVERMDRTKLGDKSVNLPCLGIFEMQEGKIREWRDYFDMATYVKATS